MKFGNILKAHIQPEYEMYYIRYNILKKNITLDEFIFIKQLKAQIDIVEKFYNQNKNEKDLLDFCLLNLFAILKIVKKFNKKNEINITKIIHHYYIKNCFYKDLFDSNIRHTKQNIDECIICYEKNQYLINQDCNHNVCWNCSLKLYQNNFEKCIVCKKKVNPNPLIQKLEGLTQMKCNPIYHKSLSDKSSKKLIFLGIDGLRPDCLLFAKTPSFDEIIRKGVINFDTEIITHAISGQSWCTILSGTKEHNVHFNEEVEDDLFQWNIQNIFTLLKSKNVDTSAFTGNWKGIKNITKDAGNKEFFYSNELLHNDKQVINKTMDKLFENGDDDEFIFSYIGGIDKTGHNYGFSIQTEEYIDYIEKIDQILHNLFKIIQQNNYSLIVTTDHGGSKYTDFTESQSRIFDSIDYIKGQKDNKCKGIHGLEIPQHKRTFQIYYGKSYKTKEILGKTYSNHIHQKIIQYFKPEPPPNS